MIIDYCGTLSLEAPRFGRPENLVRVLAESGLAALGVSTPEVFWGTIVDPTWVEGSTTSIGFAQVMAERIESLCLAPDAPTSEIEAATARFVATYLASSRIDPRWRSLLSRLNENPAVMTVVATDHYAEATGKITGYLDSWGIPARKTGKGEEPPLPSRIQILRCQLRRPRRLESRPTLLGDPEVTAPPGVGPADPPDRRFRLQRSAGRQLRRAGQSPGQEGEDRRQPWRDLSGRAGGGSFRSAGRESGV